MWNIEKSPSVDSEQTKIQHNYCYTFRFWGKFINRKCLCTPPPLQCLTFGYQTGLLSLQGLSQTSCDRPIRVKVVVFLNSGWRWPRLHLHDLKTTFTLRYVHDVLNMWNYLHLKLPFKATILQFVRTLHSYLFSAYKCWLLNRAPCTVVVKDTFHMNQLPYPTLPCTCLVNQITLVDCRRVSVK